MGHQKARGRNDPVKRELGGMRHAQAQSLAYAQANGLAAWRHERAEPSG